MECAFHMREWSLMSLISFLETYRLPGLGLWTWRASLFSHIVTPVIVRAVFSAFLDFYTALLWCNIIFMIVGLSLCHLHSDLRWASHSTKLLRDNT